MSFGETSKVPAGPLGYGPLGGQYYGPSGWIPAWLYSGNPWHNYYAPDIFDFNTGVDTFNEIKPFSLITINSGGISFGGIPDGIRQILKYWDAYSPANSYTKGFRPQALWVPPGQPIFCPMDGHLYYVFNLGGILFYTTDKSIKGTMVGLGAALATAGTAAAVKALFMDAEPEIMQATEQATIRFSLQTAETMVEAAYEGEELQGVDEDASATLATVM